METLYVWTVTGANVAPFNCRLLRRRMQNWARLQRERGQPPLSGWAPLKVVCPHLRLWWLLFLNGKIEKCTRSCHGKRKKPRSCSHTFRCPSGAAVWHIINKLFIWRQTCFFDGGEWKKRDALPYCVSKELWLEKKVLFLHRRKEETRPRLSIGKETPPVSREDRCVLTGLFS